MSSNQTDLTKKFILARLKLAQTLLEESDRLLGDSGYARDTEEWWLHPRHEREALVVYLLLTCFDRLGQNAEYVAYASWIRSKNKVHIEERERVLQHFKSNASDLVDVAIALDDIYQSIYGVKVSFFRGVERLSTNAKEKLFKSVSVSFNPLHAEALPNTSYPGYPLEDKKLETKKIIEYIFSRRNRFTHGLDQFFRASSPAFSSRQFENGSSWVASIRAGELQYINGEYEQLAGAKGYGCSVHGWPFVLFDVLYQAIDIDFDVTSIDIKFQVWIEVDELPLGQKFLVNSVEHSDLKDPFAFVERNLAEFLLK